MKEIQWMAFFFISLGVTYSHAQRLTIKKTDSTTVTTTVVASSSKEIRTSEGVHISFSEIAIVTFMDYLPKRDDTLIRKLEAFGVQVAQADGHTPANKGFEIKKGDPLYVPVKTKSKYAKDTIVNMDQIVNSLEQFRKKRTEAKVFQLIGAMALSATLVMNTVASNQIQADAASGAALKSGYKAPTYMPSAVPIAGAISLTIGIGIDIGAGTPLKVRVK